jgi:DNA (cytosine-5)-methyltransferase 1
MIVDLFAGLGGHDVGLRLEGRTDVVGYELDPDACASARANGLVRVEGDLSTFEPRDTLPGVPVEGHVGSPPCQGFSPAGKGLGMLDMPTILEGVGELAAGRRWTPCVRDPRSALLLQPLRWALAQRPEWIIWEQVPKVLPVWLACADVLGGMGMHTWAGCVTAERHGTPQTRRRAILLASVWHPVAEPTATHSRYHVRDPGRLDTGVAPWVSMGAALHAAGGWTMGDLPQRRGAVRGLDRPAPTMLASVDNGNLRWRLAGAGATSETTAGQPPRELDAPAHGATTKGTAAWVLRMSNQEHAARRGLDRPAATIVPGNRSNLISWHPEHLAGDVKDSGVRLSVREMLVLQGFPADTVVRGGVSSRYRQVGNAIPPQVTAACYREVR